VTSAPRLASNVPVVTPRDVRRARVLHVAFICDPDFSMESRIGWWRAVHAARAHDVTVLYHEGRDPGQLAERAAAEGVGDRLRFVRIQRGVWGSLLCGTATTYYMGYRLWHRAAFEAARRLHAEAPFDLVHQTTYCGYREPGLGWKLGAPFAWGPVGGTQSFPTAFLGQLPLKDAWIEVFRNAINAFQLRFSSRVRSAANRAAVLLTATRKAQSDLKLALGVDSTVVLETAIDIPIDPPRAMTLPSEPLRILWAGRLRAWKTLSLLLDALAKLPADVDYRLRVLGEGPMEGVWRSHAERLGIATRIEWVGWGPYRETLHHYRWADCFAFTSMRDTSGTGLLEALAAGAPLVTVDHQGAADIVTDECGLRAPVDRPSTTVAAFAEALERLARDRELLHGLSHGATARAADFLWERQAEPLLRWYSGCLGERASSGGTLPPQPTRPGSSEPTPRSQHSAASHQHSPAGSQHSPQVAAAFETAATGV
jgi:glycosyltransferase involved in cell wall biosynthesis